MDLVYWQWRAGISGLNTGPVEHPGICGASLPCPASDSSCEVCLRVQLLTPPASQARALRAGCWPDFSQVGLSRTRFRITHWVTITHFIPTYRDSQGLGFTLARAFFCYVAILLNIFSGSKSIVVRIFCCVKLLFCLSVPCMLLEIKYKNHNMIRLDISRALNKCPT